MFIHTYFLFNYSFTYFFISLLDHNGILKEMPPTPIDTVTLEGKHVTNAAISSNGTLFVLTCLLI